jgi:hypothetical protein
MGTYGIAMIAKACKKPLYVITERYFLCIHDKSSKFVHICPLNQRDLERCLPSITKDEVIYSKFILDSEASWLILLLPSILVCYLQMLEY